MSELSGEDIKRIARHFLLSSPAGELEDVLTDVRALVADDGLISECAPEIFHTYNIEQLTTVEVPESPYRLVLSKYNEVDQTHYVDPRTSKVVGVDHMKAVVTDVAESDAEDAQAKERRENIQDALDTYLYEHFVVGSVNSFTSSENKNEVIICISSSKFNQTNFWSGRWRSVWRASFTSDTKVKLSGTMKLNIHYYEEGNVQLNTSLDHGETIDAKSAADVGTEIVKVLKKVETSFQSKAEEICTNLSATTFKALRRKLPVTGEPMNFASASHKLVNEMRR